MNIRHILDEEFRGKRKEYRIPDWTEYFLSLAIIASARSKDAQTKHGCVITSKKNHILATGYNSFPRQMHDDLMPNLRPCKYAWMKHSERNALDNVMMNPHLLHDPATAYITGHPCLNCLQDLWNNNIDEIYYLEGVSYANEQSEKDNIFIMKESVPIRLYEIKWTPYLLKLKETINDY